ncbi:hypothetical protein BKN37_13570 [Mycobacterium talmoniae]|uniref:AB hydrolase-1 domain-containing protein n=1 Tax=Mycobacterium talmoniae TaxID=1858794 RepID=A0A1S1NIL8_9MYCO|nr:hypothetical protein BKN37_13570 [Mycobacterium talmoniae]
MFLHGFCLAGVAWARQIAKLRRRYGNRIRIVSFDHRGHGQSDPAPMHTYHVEQLAEDLAEVLAALDVTGTVTFIGHSMGGMVALAYLARPAAQRPVDPEGLVLVATAAGNLTQRGLGRLLATPATPALFALLTHTPEHLLKAMAGPVCAALGRWYGCGRAERATVSTLAVTALTRTPVSTAVGFLPSLRDHNQMAVLPTIRARTVIVSGGNDLLTPPDRAEELAAAIPGATHVHVRDAGHMLPQQVPHVIDEAVRQVMAMPHQPDAVAGAGAVDAITAGGGYALAAAGVSI